MAYVKMYYRKNKQICSCKNHGFMKTDGIYSVQSCLKNHGFIKTDSIYSVQSCLKSKVTSFVGNVYGERHC